MPTGLRSSIRRGDELSETDHVVVWWRGKRYEGTWGELYPIIRRDVDVCQSCRCEYLGLERSAWGLLCKECIQKKLDEV